MMYPSSVVTGRRSKGYLHDTGRHTPLLTRAERLRAQQDQGVTACADADRIEECRLGTQERGGVAGDLEAKSVAG